MKNVSTQFRNELNNGNRYYVKSAEITLKDETTLEISNSNLWQNGMILESATSNSSSFDISSIIIGQLTLSLNNIDEEYSDYDFTDCTADNIKVGLELSDGTVESLLYGKFFLNDASYNGSIITLTFYDSLYKFDKSYTESDLEYPATLEDIVQDACEVCGVTLGTYGFDHDDYLINERPTSDGLTFRQMLLWVGQISCNYFTADPQGRLKISWYDTKSLEALITNVEQSNLLDSAGDDILDSDGNPISTDKEVSEIENNIVGGNYHIINHFSNLSVGLDDVVITGIKISYEESGENGTEITTYQAGTDGYVLEISGNKLIQSGDAAQQIVQDLGAKIIGLRFRTFTASALSDPTYEAGDVALLIDRKGRRYKTLITNNTFQPGNFQSVSCGATAPARQSASRYSQITQVYVDYRKDLQKEKTEREQAIEELQNRVNNSSGLFTTIEQQPDGSNIYYLHNKPQLSDSDIIWTMTAEAWTVSTNGGETPNAGMTVDGDTIVRILTAVGVNADWIKTGAFVVEKDGQIMFRADTDTGQVDIVANSFSLQGQSISDIAEQQVNDFVDTVYTPAIDNLQAQIDGQIETWFYDYIPTTTNYPASNWTTDTERDKHLGDLFYVVDNAEYGGQAYRWAKISNVYTWDYVEDTAVTKALADAAAAQDTADQKRRVFVSQPVPPYDVGDLWVGNSSSDLMRCQTSRQSGNYNAADWIKAVKYTDDSELQAFIQGDYADTIEEIKTQADQKAETWYQSTDPSINWSEDEKSEHKGDLWYNTSEEKTYIYNGTSWQETRSNPPDEVFDTINGKAQIFIAQPVTPYDVGDVWFTGTSIMVCNTARTSGNFNSADWQKKDNYTDDSALYEFIEGDYQSTIENLQEQADQKAETWYQATDPSASWSTADKSKHKGDLWYNTTEQKTYIYNGSAWEETKSNPPDEVFDTIDGKAQIYVNTPVPPYNVGDLWFNSSTSDIMTCINARSTGSYTASDWQKRNKYTDDSALNNFIENEFSETIDEISNQIDGKAETWYQSTDPSTSWTTTALKNEHVGDIWYNTTSSVQKSYRWDGTSWQEMKTTPPDEVFDQIDGKAQVFVTTPTPPYNIGDLWVQGITGDIMRCQTNRTSGSYNASDWVRASKYTDDSLAEQVQEELNNMEIGGRNLAQLTNQGVTGWTWNMQSGDYTKEEILSNGIRSCKLTRGNTSQSGWSVIGYIYISPQKYEENAEYTVSFDVLPSVSTSFTIALREMDGTDTLEASTQSTGNLAANSWSHITVTITTKDTLPTSRNQYLYMTSMNSSVGVSYTFKNLKIEKGNKATGWSPAPEDTETYADNLAADLQEQIDGKIQTYSQTSDPSASWTTTDLKTQHTGDLWYNPSTKVTQRWSGTTWVKLENAEAEDAAELAQTKAQIFISQPIPPYSVGDLWFNSATSDIMTCVTSRASGSYTASDWQKRNKYTDDSYAEQVQENLSSFSELVTGEMNNMQVQIDGKIETYYYDYQPTLTNIPASEWTTDEERTKHVGDLFYWQSKGFTYRFTPDGNTFKWQAIQDSDITEALQQAANAQDTADSKRRVFYTMPSPPYDVGDLWAQGSGGDIMRCKTARQSGAYVSADWELASKYTDDTAVDNLDDSLDQEGVFNRLTNNGATQGIYLENGQLYINASYIQSGIVSADRIDVTGIFAQDITATGTITGANLVGATGTFSGTINASGGTFSGNIDCTGTITGANLVGASGTFSGDISGSTFTGGQIKSTNYVQGSLGTLINLNDGSISTYYTYSSPVITNGVNSAFLSNGQLRLVAPDASVYPMTNSATSEVVINGYEISFSHTSGNQIMNINVAGLTTSGWVDASQIIGDSFLCDGWLTANGQAQLNGGVFAPYMELSAPAPYIDFHYNKTTTDYTARIIADGAGGANSLRIYARGGLYLTGGTFIVEAQDSANEGGEIRLNGAGSNKQVCIDNLSGNLRVYTQNPYKIMIWNASTGGLELPYGGLSVVSAITSSLNTGSWLAGNNGTAIISSTSSGDNFNVLARMLAPTGRFIMGQYDGDFFLAYTRNSTIQAGTNYVDSLAKLLNNNGNTAFPGTVTAANFSNSSLEELKTNIVPFDSALEDIINTDVYSYSLKRDIDNGFYNTKYGFIIGTGYRLSEKILSEEKDGIELYSAIALLWKGVQELYELVSGMGIVNSRIDYLQSQLDQAFERIEQLKKASA